jgi:hypothetical protein
MIQESKNVKSALDKIRELDIDNKIKSKLYDIVVQATNNSYQNGAEMSREIWKPKK